MLVDCIPVCPRITSSKYHLNPKCIVSQGYDGAAVMAGRSTGVQTHIKTVAPYMSTVMPLSEPMFSGQCKDRV